MFESILEKLILAYFGDIFTGMDRSNMKLGLFSGNLIIQNVGVKSEAIESLPFPIGLIYSHIGYFQIKIPWTRLFSSPIEITIENVFVLVGPKKRQDWQLWKLRDYESKIQELMEWYKNFEKKENDKKDYGNKVTKILDNIRISVKNLHIRFEDKEFKPAFSFGLTLNTFRIYPKLIKEENEEKISKEYISRKPKEDFQRELEIKSLALYWKGHEMNHFQTRTATQILSKFLSFSLFDIDDDDKKKSDYIFDISTTMHINQCFNIINQENNNQRRSSTPNARRRRKNYLSLHNSLMTKSSEVHTLFIKLDKIELNIWHSQYQSINRFLQLLNEYFRISELIQRNWHTRNNSKFFLMVKDVIKEKQRQHFIHFFSRILFSKKKPEKCLNFKEFEAFKRIVVNNEMADLLKWAKSSLQSVAQLIEGNRKSKSSKSVARFTKFSNAFMKIKEADPNQSIITALIFNESSDFFKNISTVKALDLIVKEFNINFLKKQKKFMEKIKLEIKHFSVNSQNSEFQIEVKESTLFYISDFNKRFSNKIEIVKFNDNNFAIKALIDGNLQRVEVNIPNVEVDMFLSLSQRISNFFTEKDYFSGDGQTISTIYAKRKQSNEWAINFNIEKIQIKIPCITKKMSFYFFLENLNIETKENYFRIFSNSVYGNLKRKNIGIKDIIAPFSLAGDYSSGSETYIDLRINETLKVSGEIQDFKDIQEILVSSDDIQDLKEPFNFNETSLKKILLMPTVSGYLLKRKSFHNYNQYFAALYLNDIYLMEEKSTLRIDQKISLKGAKIKEGENQFGIKNTLKITEKSGKIHILEITNYKELKNWAKNIKLKIKNSRKNVFKNFMGVWSGNTEKVNFVPNFDFFLNVFVENFEISITNICHKYIIQNFKIKNSSCIAKSELFINIQEAQGYLTNDSIKIFDFPTGIIYNQIFFSKICPDYNYDSYSISIDIHNFLILWKISYIKEIFDKFILNSSNNEENNSSIDNQIKNTFELRIRNLKLFMVNLNNFLESKLSFQELYYFQSSQFNRASTKIQIGSLFLTDLTKYPQGKLIYVNKDVWDYQFDNDNLILVKGQNSKYQFLKIEIDDNDLSDDRLKPVNSDIKRSSIFGNVSFKNKDDNILKVDSSANFTHIDAADKKKSSANKKNNLSINMDGLSIVFIQQLFMRNLEFLMIDIIETVNPSEKIKDFKMIEENIFKGLTSMINLKIKNISVYLPEIQKEDFIDESIMIDDGPVLSSSKSIFDEEKISIYLKRLNLSNSLEHNEIVSKRVKSKIYNLIYLGEMENLSIFNKNHENLLKLPVSINMKYSDIAFKEEYKIMYCNFKKEFSKWNEIQLNFHSDLVLNLQKSDYSDLLKVLDKNLSFDDNLNHFFKKQNENRPDNESRVIVSFDKFKINMRYREKKKLSIEMIKLNLLYFSSNYTENFSLFLKEFFLLNENNQRVIKGKSTVFDNFLTMKYDLRTKKNDIQITNPKITFEYANLMNFINFISGSDDEELLSKFTDLEEKNLIIPKIISESVLLLTISDAILKFPSDDTPNRIFFKFQLFMSYRSVSKFKIDGDNHILDGIEELNDNEKVGINFLSQAFKDSNSKQYQPLNLLDPEFKKENLKCFFQDNKILKLTINDLVLVEKKFTDIGQNKSSSNRILRIQELCFNQISKSKEFQNLHFEISKSSEVTISKFKAIMNKNQYNLILNSFEKFEIKEEDKLWENPENESSKKNFKIINDSFIIRSNHSEILILNKNNLPLISLEFKLIPLTYLKDSFYSKVDIVLKNRIKLFNFNHSSMDPLLEKNFIRICYCTFEEKEIKFSKKSEISISTIDELGEESAISLNLSDSMLKSAYEFLDFFNEDDAKKESYNSNIGLKYRNTINLDNEEGSNAQSISLFKIKNLSGYDVKLNYFSETIEILSGKLTHLDFSYDKFQFESFIKGKFSFMLFFNSLYDTEIYSIDDLNFNSTGVYKCIWKSQSENNEIYLKNADGTRYFVSRISLENNCKLLTLYSSHSIFNILNIPIQFSILDNQYSKNTKFSFTIQPNQSYSIPSEFCSSSTIISIKFLTLNISSEDIIIEFNSLFKEIMEFELKKNFYIVLNPSQNNKNFWTTLTISYPQTFMSFVPSDIEIISTNHLKKANECRNNIESSRYPLLTSRFRNTNTIDLAEYIDHNLRIENKKELFVPYFSSNHNILLKLKFYEFLEYGYLKISDNSKETKKDIIFKHQKIKSIQYKILVENLKNKDNKGTKFLFFCSSILRNETKIPIGVYIKEGQNYFCMNRTEILLDKIALPEKVSKLYLKIESNQSNDPNTKEYYHEISLTDLTNSEIHLETISKNQIKIIEFNILVKIENIDEKSENLMKVFEIHPKFVLINKMENFLFFRQDGDSEIYSIKPEKRKILSWPNKYLEKTFQLSIGKEENRKWCEKVRIYGEEIIDIMVLEDENIERIRKFIRCQIIKKDFSTFIMIKELNEDSPAYKIINNSEKYIINVGQKNDKARFNIDKGKELPFAWHRPSELKVLQVIIMHENSVSTQKSEDSGYEFNLLNIDQRGKISQYDLEWISYVDDKSVVLEFKDNNGTKRTHSINESTQDFSINLGNVGISFICKNHENKNVELIFGTIKGINFSYKKSQSVNIIDFKIKYINIDDNLNFYSSNPVILTPYKPENLFKTDEQFFQLYIDQDSQSKNILFIREIKIYLTKFALKIEEDFLDFCLYLLCKFYKKELSWNVDEEIKNNESHDNLEISMVKLANSNYNQPLWKREILEENSPLVYFRDVSISSLKFTVSLLKTEGYKSKYLGSFLGIKNFPNIEEAPISLDSFRKLSIFETKADFITEIIDHYKKITFQALIKILGSLEIIGNPTKLISIIKSALQDFIKILKDKWNEENVALALSIGFLYGIKLVVKRSVAGTCNSLQKIFLTFSNGMANLSFDQSYILKRRMIKNKKAIHLADGIMQGSRALMLGIEEAIIGIARQPIEGIKSDGVFGFIIGTIQAFYGLLLKPLSGAFDATAKTAEGLKNCAIRHDDNLNDQRIRIPRAFYDSEKYFKEYSKNDAEVYSLIKSLRGGKYSGMSFLGSFLLVNDLKKNRKLIIMLREVILIMQDKNKKILFEIPVSSIESIECQNNFNFKEMKIVKFSFKDVIILLFRNPLKFAISTKMKNT